VAAHILPFSLLFNKASIWAIIESFPDIKFAEGDNIHSLTSIITLYTARFFRPAGCMVAAVPEKPTTIFRKTKDFIIRGT